MRKIKQITATTEYHTGNIVKAELTAQGKSIVWLANEVHRSPSSMYRMLKKKYIDMKTFRMFCIALKANLAEAYFNNIDDKIKENRKLTNKN